MDQSPINEWVTISEFEGATIGIGIKYREIPALIEYLQKVYNEKILASQPEKG